MPSDPPTSPQRHIWLPLVAGLVVAVLAGGAFTLTYGIVRDFALAGGVGDRWAPAYPVMLDALMVMTVLALLVARTAPWWARWLRGALLLLLLAATAAIAVQHAVWGFTSVPEGQHRAGVAVAPHLMLATALWLWFRMFRHLRPRTPGSPHPPEQPDPAQPTQPVAQPTTTADLEGAEQPVHAEQARPAPQPASDADPEDAGQAGSATDLESAERPVHAESEQPAAVAGGHDGAGRSVRAEPGRAAEADAAEQDAGDGEEEEGELRIWDWDPPSRTLRSSPTPPLD